MLFFVYNLYIIDIFDKYFTDIYNLIFVFQYSRRKIFDLGKKLFTVIQKLIYSIIKNCTAIIINRFDFLQQKFFDFVLYRSVWQIQNRKFLFWYSCFRSSQIYIFDKPYRLFYYLNISDCIISRIIEKYSVILNYIKKKK